MIAPRQAPRVRPVTPRHPARSRTIAPRLITPRWPAPGAGSGSWRPVGLRWRRAAQLRPQAMRTAMGPRGAAGLPGARGRAWPTPPRAIALPVAAVTQCRTAGAGSVRQVTPLWPSAGGRRLRPPMSVAVRPTPMPHRALQLDVGAQRTPARTAGLPPQDSQRAARPRPALVQAASRVVPAALAAARGGRSVAASPKAGAQCAALPARHVRMRWPRKMSAARHVAHRVVLARPAVVAFQGVERARHWRPRPASARTGPLTPAQLRTREVELSWRRPAPVDPAAQPATPARAIGAADAAAVGTAPESRVPGQAPPALYSGRQDVPALFDHAVSERLVDQVLQRAEQRLRVERERRGL